MSEYVCNLTLYARRSPEAYRVRDAIRKLLEQHTGCKVMSCGRSCIDPSITDVEFRVKSHQIAKSVVAAVRRAYANGCDIDVEMTA